MKFLLDMGISPAVGAFLKEEGYESVHLRKRCDPLPESFDSLNDFWDFWETHNTADYEDRMDDFDVNVDIRFSKVYCAVAKELAAQLRTQAQRQGFTTETLINLWLREKVTEPTQAK